MNAWMANEWVDGCKNRWEEMDGFDKGNKPRLDFFSAELAAPQCSPTEITACAMSALNNIAVNKCNCPVPCRKICYSKQMSMAYFPSQHYWETKLGETSEATTRIYQEHFRWVLELTLSLPRSRITERYWELVLWSFILVSFEKPSSSYCVMLHFWWSYGRGSLKLITLGSERVKTVDEL